MVTTFFDQLTERYSALFADQDAGLSAFHLLFDEDASVLGRFNFYEIKDATAGLGYRVAQHVAGHGVATAAVRELGRLAAARYGLRALMAAASDENVASRKGAYQGWIRSCRPSRPRGRRRQARHVVPAGPCRGAILTSPS